MNGADTAWIIVATALVLFMSLPGLALFYGGLVRARNVLSVFMHVYAIACLMSILWLAFGYTIAFGDASHGWFGSLDKAFLSGVTADSLSGTLPEVLFFAFQMTFAIITPALIVGAYVERVGFGFVLTFSSLWMLLCYAPWCIGSGAAAHWLMAASLERLAPATLQAVSWCTKLRASQPDDRCGPWTAQTSHHTSARTLDGLRGRSYAVGRLVRLQRRLATGR